MTKLELLENEAIENNIDIIQYHFNSERIKGLYCDGTVAIANSIKKNSHKTCILAEELGHYYTSTGDIIEQSSASNRKQEYRARLWSYNRVIGLSGIISAFKAGCNSLYEMADHLEVEENILQDALSCYRQKYGVCTQLDNYVINFEPSIGVFELI